MCTEDKKTFLSAQLRGGTISISTAWGGSARLDTQARIQEGRWQHVAVVHTRGRFRRLQGGSEMRIFVDGQLRDSKKVHFLLFLF